MRAVYLLIGEVPIIAYLHIKILTFYGNISRSRGSTVHSLAIRQMAMKDSMSKSWYSHVKTLFSLYDLGNPVDLLQTPVEKLYWKKLVKESVLRHHHMCLLQEAEEKSTLDLLYCTSLRVHHSVWDIYRTDQISLRKSYVKSKFLIGTYLLQQNKFKYKQSDSPLCPLCQLEPEDRTHFILECKEASSIIGSYSDRFIKLLPPVLSNVYEENSNFVYNILNPNTLSEYVNVEVLEKLEDISRNWIFDLHKQRALKLQYRV